MTATVVVVVGARPNFMKAAPVLDALRGGPLRASLLHTGQHYDDGLSGVFFRELGLPEPDAHLGIGSGAHGEQSARTLRAVRDHLAALPQRPVGVVVVGDVNSTLAAALAARALGLPVAHVEAGLRSFDRSMPEEVNRVAVDAVSDLLLVTEPAGVENLVAEGVPAERVRLTGNVMIDTLLRHLPAARSRFATAPPVPAGERFALVTLHRPSNVDDPAQLRGVVEFLRAAAGRLPVLFPVHPRTAAALERAGLRERLAAAAGVRLVDPLAYLDMVGAMAASAAVVTDSGGIQEETSALGIPCITLRENTERPVTLARGTNVLAGRDPARALALLDEVLAGRARPGERIELWDGRAGIRVAEALAEAWAPDPSGPVRPRRRL